MTKEFKFTMKEVKDLLVRAVGEAFALTLKEKVTDEFTPTHVRMKNWLGTTEADLIPEKLDYSTEEDFITVRIKVDGNYEVSYFASDGLTFSVTDECYSNLVDRFVNYFINIYRA